MGIVRGHVVLNVAVEGFRGTRLLIVEPVTAPNLRIDTVVGGGRALVVADNLNPGEGQLIGFVEGREAANPFYPTPVPIDAFCALIIDEVEYHPPATGPESEKAA